MKLRTVVIATLLAYAVYFREGDNEYPKEKTFTEALLHGIGGLPLEPVSSPKLGVWLVFERMILLRHQALPNQGRSTPPPRVMRQTPEPPKGWVAMTMPGFMRALGSWKVYPEAKA